MSSSAPRSGEKRMIHQDFIARIRYSNALPPPPNPPKLLDIPNTGLSSGQYTTPGFVSRLAREQPLNVEADAELGMPLDLVGMPGVFDGDERSVQAPAKPPPVHPHDRLLLRPVSALGKHKVAEASVSFLRRTEYISSIASKRHDGGNPRALLAKSKRFDRRAPEAAADSPQIIKRKIDMGFDAAEKDLKDPKRLKHPTRRHLQLVDAVPLLPDLDSFPDSGAYVTIKFLTNPVQSGSRYDHRLLSGIFRPIDRTKPEEEAYEAALAAYKEDEVNNIKPQNLMNYDFYLAHGKSTGDRFRDMFDPETSKDDDKELYTHETDTGGCFQFNRLRAYETAQEEELDHTSKYSQEILLATNDTEEYPRQKAVYYYPIMQKSTIRPQRTKNIARTILQPDEEEDTIIDQLDVTVEDPSEEMRTAMERYKTEPLGFEDEEEEPQGEDELPETLDNDAQDDEARNGNSPLAGATEERDAEGEEDEED